MQTGYSVERRRLPVRAGRLIAGGFGDLDGEDVGGSKHVGPEHHPFLVGREAHVGLQAVLMPRHIHQALGPEDAWLDEARVLGAAIGNGLGAE